MSEKWGLNALAGSLRWASLTRTQRAELARMVLRQEEVIRILCILPGQHSYEQVDAAINAADVLPVDIYESLAANRQTIALSRFYEALHGLEQEQPS